MLKVPPHMASSICMEIHDICTQEYKGSHDPEVSWYDKKWKICISEGVHRLPQKCCQWPKYIAK